jgi:hypothetical protein
MDFLNKYIIGLLCTLFCFTALASSTPVVCEQEYALCTSARCIPTPGSSTEAMCDCVVEKGNSVGYKTCEQRKPQKNKYNATTLISTFSFAQFSDKRPMSCPKGAPWTNCVDMPCTVDPQNAKRALCMCKIDSTQAFFTFGGGCDQKTCATGFWSGATLKAGDILRNALLQKTNSKQTIPEACAALPSSNEGVGK